MIPEEITGSSSWLAIVKIHYGKLFKSDDIIVGHV